MKVALITGANSGIGLALSERLIASYPDIHLCLACRSKSKAESARQRLLKSMPTATVSIVLADMSSMSSIYEAAHEIRSRFHHLDFLFLNAGIMPDTTVDWSNFFAQLFSSKCIRMFATGEGLLQQKDQVTSEGMRQIFVTNVFGHFVLVKELESILGGSSGNSQIVWTSSSNARKDAFNLNDLQHRNGKEGYSSSKYASDLASYALNEHLNRKGIYSQVTCPGLVITNLTIGILPWWVWFLMLPLLWLLRLFVPSMTVTPENGCEALFWLTTQNPKTLSPVVKYSSRVSFGGKRYVSLKKMDLDRDLAKETFRRLSKLERECSVMFKRT